MVEELAIHQVRIIKVLVVILVAIISSITITIDLVQLVQVLTVVSFMVSLATSGQLQLVSRQVSIEELQQAYLALYLKLDYVSQNGKGP